MTRSRPEDSPSFCGLGTEVRTLRLCRVVPRVTRRAFDQPLLYLALLNQLIEEVSESNLAPLLGDLLQRGGNPSSRARKRFSPSVPDRAGDLRRIEGLPGLRPQKTEDLLLIGVPSSPPIEIVTRNRHPRVTSRRYFRLSPSVPLSGDLRHPEPGSSRAARCALSMTIPFPSEQARGPQPGECHRPSRVLALETGLWSEKQRRSRSLKDWVGRSSIRTSYDGSATALADL